LRDFFSFVLEDDARGHYYSAMIGLDVRGLDAHDLAVRGLDAHDLAVHGLDAHGLDAHGLDARGLDAHDLDDRGLDVPDLDVPTDVAEEIQLQRLPLD